MITICRAFTLVLALSLLSCSNDKREGESAADNNKIPEPAAIKVPAFNADSAYNYVATQVGFGPRIPGSAAQKKCADWLHDQLKTSCDTVYRQDVTVKGYDGKVLPCINLIGAINPAVTNRILLLAHWDSRSWADNDVRDTDKAVLGADDGASGVAALLEIARQVKAQGLSPQLGIDILLVDVEDYGRDAEDGDHDSYCLGTQYWAKHPHIAGYKARYGILLDMVGGRGATFPLETMSSRYAPQVQQMIWQTANRAGYSSYFPFKQSGAITDDHKYVTEMANIPTVDIISLSSTTESGFPAHWHTHADDLNIIDKKTLKAVGQTVLQVIYEAAPQAS